MAFRIEDVYKVSANWLYKGDIAKSQFDPEPPELLKQEIESLKKQLELKDKIIELLEGRNEGYVKGKTSQK